MTTARGRLYRWARLLGDAQAAERGPGEYGKRVARRVVYRHVNQQTRRVLRSLGLSK